MTANCFRRLLPLLVLLLAACAVQPPPLVAPAPAATAIPLSAPEAVLGDLEIATDTIWEGRLVIDGAVRVRQGTTLTIRPGTEIVFRRRDGDGDGLGDAALIVEGALHAEGTRARPIRFRSAAAKPQPGDWLEIRVDSSSDVRLRWCEVRDAAYALHLRASRGFLEDCTIRRNIDGSSFDQARVAMRNCLIEENEGNGINLRSSQVEIARNIVRYNGVGVFLAGQGGAVAVHGNNIHGNGDNFRLGDAETGSIRLAGNWWGTAGRREAEATVHDRRRDPQLGLVTLEPAPAWIAATGPRDRVVLQEAWRFETGGFVDAGPAAGSEAVYVTSWDGHLYALDAAGKLLWKKAVGDVVDSPPVVDGGVLYVQNWRREVRALDRRDGREIWRFAYAPSPADDHRQGGVALAGDLVLVPGWNGHLYALDSVTGGRLWQADAGSPLRAAPAAGGERIYQGSGSGVLSAWTPGGASLWQRDLGAPLLATPAVTPHGPVAVSRDGLLVAFDADGRERWRRDLGEECSYGAPLYAGRALYLGTAAGTLWKLDAASGRTIWRFAASGPLSAAPLLTDGRLVVGDQSARLFVIGADSGDLLASFRAEGEIQGTPARLGNRLVFGSRDHLIYGLAMAEAEDASPQVPVR